MYLCSGAFEAGNPMVLASEEATQPLRQKSHNVAQADLELLDSIYLPTSASQSAEIIGVSHCIWLISLPNTTDFTPLPRLECSGTISAHCSLRLLRSIFSRALAFQVVTITDVQNHTQLIFVFLVETGFYHVGQAGSGAVTQVVTELPPSVQCNWSRKGQRANRAIKQREEQGPGSMLKEWLPACPPGSSEGNLQTGQSRLSLAEL
ncbi:hypothetical protein AAY473_030637 [Plecturocebus cupreus]